MQKKIKKSGVIYKSVTKPDGRDVNFGEGTYGTPLGPENGRKALAQNNYNHAWKHFEDQGRVDVVIRRHESVNGRQIYIYDGDIYLNECDEVDFIYFKGQGKYDTEKYK